MILAEKLLSANRRAISLFLAGTLLMAWASVSTAQSADSDQLKETSKSLARTAAEITQRIEDQNQRPRRTYITPSTREVGYAMYYQAVQKRIEEIGTRDFPKKNGEKLYGNLVVYIPIYQDGKLYMKKGGPSVEKSSGNADLDQAALEIIRKAAPFDRFPPKMVSTDNDDLWIIITRFNFTRNETPGAQASEAR